MNESGDGLKVAVCDDDKVVVAGIEKELYRLAGLKNISIDIDVFYNGNELINYINSGNKYDLIYMDIEMPHMNGIESAMEIRKTHTDTLLIYITGHESFAKDVFEVDTFRFLTKPIEFGRFEKYFYDAAARLGKTGEFFHYQYKKVSYRTAVNDIMYFQSDKRVTYIVDKNDTAKCYHRLNDIEKTLKEKGVEFLRIHQSFLVNPRYIKRYMHDSVELVNGEILSVSENRRKKVAEQFCKLKGEDIVV